MFFQVFGEVGGEHSGAAAAGGKGVGFVGESDFGALFSGEGGEVDGAGDVVVGEFFGRARVDDGVAPPPTAETAETQNRGTFRNYNSGIRALARDCFKNRLSAEVADIFISLARNKNSAMTVIFCPRRNSFSGSWGRGVGLMKV